MLVNWTISNFKSIRKPLTLQLAPLTVFCGPNSSGKSAFIQSILMVAQSLGSPAWQEPLVLNGRFVRLGHLEDILHHGYEKEEMRLGFTIVAGDGCRITVSAVFEGKKVKDRATTGRLKPQVRRCKVQAGSQAKLPNGGERVELVWHPLELPESELEKVHATLREHIAKGIYGYDIVHPKRAELSRGQMLEEPLSASLSNFLPGRVLMRVRTHVRNLTLEIEQLIDAIRTLVDRPGVPTPHIDWDHELSEEARTAFEFVAQRLRRRGHQEEDHYRNTLQEISSARGRLTVRGCTEIIKRRLNHGQIGDLSRRLSGAVREMQRELLSDPRAREKTDLEVGSFPAQYSQTIDEVKEVLGNTIYYLGPLRDDPKLIYAIPPLPTQRDVGLKGEYTAAILDTHRDRKVRYPVPPKEFGGKYTLKEGKLAEALQIWLQRMGLVESVETEEMSKAGYQLAVQTAGINKRLDLTSVGVGVSQTLPTLVIGLLAPEDSILIFEQPELHLHPKVQSILGDFFLGLASCGKQCIIETHSEHLINRLRRRIAESPDNKLLDLLRIYFVELKEAASQFRLVEPNEYGAILDWPQGFFDEAEEESSAILRASMKKRRIRNR